MKMKKLMTVVVICTVFAFAAMGSVFAATASFQGLGDMPGGVFNSRAFDVSADGSTVVGYSISASGTEAFRWTLSGGMVGLGDLPGSSFESKANAVSADGSTIVGIGISASGPEAFRWTLSGGMVGLGYLSGWPRRRQGLSWSKSPARQPSPPPITDPAARRPNGRTQASRSPKA